MSERSTVLKVTVSLAATTVALGAAGCGADGPKYSQRTEKTIERIITPSMRLIAGTAIKLEKDSNGQVTARYLGHGLTEVSGTTTREAGLNDNNGLDEIDVVMHDYPGTENPNPNTVVLADVGSADNVTGKGLSIAGEMEFIAPDQGDLPSKVLVANAASDQVLDTKGWTALESGYTANNGVVSGGSEEDTADASEFTVDDNFNPTNPVATAKGIVSQVPDTIPVVVDNFGANSSREGSVEIMTVPLEAEPLSGFERSATVAHQRSVELMLELRPVLRKHLEGPLGQQFDDTARAILSNFYGHMFASTLEELNEGGNDFPAQSVKKPHLHLVQPDSRAEAGTGHKLIPRHLDALRLMAEGLSNRDIAKKLGYTSKSIKYAPVAINRALGVNSKGSCARAEAVRKAYEQGLLSLSPPSQESFASPLPDLKDRELEGLILQSEGKGYVEIAGKQGISRSTVKLDTEKFIDKLGARNKVHAVSIGINLGLINIGQQLILPV